MLGAIAAWFKEISANTFVGFFPFRVGCKEPHCQKIYVKTPKQHFRL
jgi:hypothetical protein